jgi:orotate phosphoribosyltransferase
MGSPVARSLVAALAYENIVDSGLEFDCIGGLEIGSIAIATSLSDYGFATKPKKHWNTFVVRKMPKGHGLRNKIEGIAGPRERALIVDDVLTTGGSVLQAVEAAREADIEVTHALVIVDRDEKNGRRNLSDKGIQLISLLSIHDLLDAKKKMHLCMI